MIITILKIIHIPGANNLEGGHIYVNSKKVEPNVDLLDEHDSFYHTTKSLLVLFQIMGVMPIMRSPPGNKIFILALK